MDTATLELDVNELNKRVAAADRDLAAKKLALDDRKAELVAEGKTAQTLTAEDIRFIGESEAEISRLVGERFEVSDLAMTLAMREARNRPEEKGLGAETLHARVLGAITKEQVMGGGISSAGFEARNRAGLISAIVGGRPWFGAAATADLDAGIPLDERLYPSIEIRRRTPRLFDLINVGATDTDTVVYTRQSTRTSAAAETALGTAYSEASFAFTQVTAAVKSIGHFTTAYRENIADAAQFDTLVRTQLQEDVMLRLETQILSGGGTGSDLTGILTESISSVSRNTSTERRVHAILRAMTSVRTGAYREPSAVLLSPLDYQDMIIEETNLTSTTGAAMAFVPDITGATPGTVWGMPIVISTVASEGTGLVAYWKDATLWVREGVSLRVSDSHSDYFTKRQVAILADMRGAFSTQRLTSYCKVLFL